ncbi:hypothetical protein AGMMS50276_06670 [Synergistales bacterium]|nr:hypothetical protein AGMMS50276_06670 [Synergistales bacterium]
MSLWEKWERDKLRAQGIEVEEPKDVIINDAPVKKNLRAQLLILALVAVCLFSIYNFMISDAAYRLRKWSGTYIEQLFDERQDARERQAKERR